MRAPGRLEWYGGKAVGAVARGRWRRRGLWGQTIYLTHQQKHGESHDQEIDDGVQEQPIVQRGRACSLGRRDCQVVRAGEVDKKI